jgi:nucleolar pre-ribosomal-associated protein 1
LSLPDRMILSIFQLFEFQRKSSISGLLGRWSTRQEVPSSSPLEAIQSLDSSLVLRTCLHWPTWRKLDDPISNLEDDEQDSLLYDPVFLILLLAQTLAESPPESAFAWVELFRTNVVGLIIRGLSCRDDHIRAVAYTQLAALWECLDVSSLM